MVAHVLGLRLASLRGAFRGRGRLLARRLLGLALLAAAVVLSCWALLTLRDAPLAVVEAVSVLCGSALALGFAAAPLITGAVDPLDPRRFALFDIPSAPLAGALALAGLLSVPVAALVALVVCLVVVWAAHGVDWGWAVAGGVLGVATCVLLARLSMALTALFLRERRSRELSGLFVVAVLVVVVPVGVFFASLRWGGSVPTPLAEAVRVLTRTPLGAFWALPAAHGGSRVLSLGVAGVTVLALAALWLLAVHVLLHTPERAAVTRGGAGLGWFAVAPAGPAGAVAARSVIYWFHDRRYLANIVIVPIGAALTVVPLVIVGVPLATAVLVPVPVMALFFGWLTHNDLAYDSTAVWLHISSGVRGVADRIGRLVPMLMLGIPVLAITVPVAVALHGRWSMLPAMSGVCAGLFLCGLGLSSISSALAPYPVSAPGSSPFRQPERTGSAGALAQGAVLLGALVLASPAGWWAWLALTRDSSYAAVAGWAGAVIGIVVLVVGVAIGAAVFERRGSALLEAVE